MGGVTGSWKVYAGSAITNAAGRATKLYTGKKSGMTYKMAAVIVVAHYVKLYSTPVSDRVK